MNTSVLGDDEAVLRGMSYCIAGIAVAVYLGPMSVEMRNLADSQNLER